MSAVIWNPINSQADIERLLTLFGGFHDGCLRGAHVWTEHYVNSDLSMKCTGDLDTRIRLLIQRQFKEPSAIELLFEQVITFHLQTSAENYDSIIFDATMLKDGDIFYWADILTIGRQKVPRVTILLGLQQRNYHGETQAIGWARS